MTPTPESMEKARAILVNEGLDPALEADLCADIATALDETVREERAAVVAWLCSNAPARVWAEACGGSEYECAATAIEKGAHVAPGTGVGRG